MRRIVYLVIAVVVLTAPWAAGADQGDSRLDTLFSQLRQSPDADQARTIERVIWEIWTHSGKDEVDGLTAVGIGAMAKGDYATALRIFDRIVEEAPGFAEGWNKRATVHFLMGDFDASVRDIVRTLDLEPRHFGALSGLGMIYLDLGKEAAALDAFEKAQEIHPHLPGGRMVIRDLRRKLNGSEI